MANRKLWVIALAIWFLLWGLIAFGVTFKYSDLIMGVLAFAVAVLVVLESSGGKNP